MQLWQHHQNVVGGGGGNFGSSIPAGATTTCQDCGNQAKKDCPHRRCRTCCKSRGYDCSTHVKSTWVPAARRRDRQTKKPRLIGGASQTTTTTAASHNTSTSRSFDETTSSHQDGGNKERLPREVSANAVFKCVRVTAVDDGGEDEYAYQGVVRIGGHVFKGFLYDQGRILSDRGLIPNVSELHLGGSNGGDSSSDHHHHHGVLDPTSGDVFGASSGGGLLGGSAYSNNAIN